MATRTVTVTLDETQLERIQGMVAAGSAPNVTAFVQQAVSAAFDDAEGWGAMLAQALSETGGPLTHSERAWADEALGLGPGAP